MAESQQQERQSTGNGSDMRKTAIRAAAIAAASGATAIAAKKAFSGSDKQNGPSRQQNGDGDSLVGGMLGSGLNAARDSLVPFAEDAAHAAGEYLASSGPDFVRETIVPAFIDGFQGGQQSSGGE